MQQSASFKEMLEPPKRTRDIRSSDQNVLFVLRIKIKKGEGSFSVAAPALWNHLPGKIRNSKTVYSFRKKLHRGFRRYRSLYIHYIFIHSYIACKCL